MSVPLSKMIAGDVKDAPGQAALDVLVIGAGFAGIAMAHGLARMPGVRFLIVEKGERVGGTWRDNTYPGCACDIPSHLYSLSFAPNPDWTRMFATQAEILDYLEGVVERFDLGRYISLDTLVEEATWDETAALWRIRLAGGREVATHSLVSAVGILHHPLTPAINGLANFAGKQIHTAAWDHDYDLTSKRVAVIGTGASAIQVVPAIADRVAHLSVYQRTPPWIAPRYDRPFDDAARAKFRTSRRHRLTYRAKLFWAHEKRATGFTKARPKSLDKTEALCRALLRRQIDDPELRMRLTPDYKVGCKRLIVSSDYYPALQKPNVALVTDAIDHIEADAIVTRDGARQQVDAIVFGTGYDAQRPLSHLPIRGVDGRPLQQVWDEDGRNALLGTTTVGFPNFYIVTGPHTGGGHNSQVFMIEAQVHYILQAIRTFRRKKARRIEVRPKAQQAFADDMDRRMERSVWKGGGCMSWFLDPKTGRNTLLWPSYSTDFWIKTRRLKSSDYKII